MSYVVRNAKIGDYYKGHLQLYSQLTKINPEQISHDNYKQFIDTLNDNHAIFVIEDKDIIIGTITVLIEQKFIHNMGKVAHIEDVVINKKFRGYGLGQLIVSHALEYAKKQGCYKTILDCADEVVAFYEKCGLTLHGHLMSIYYT